MSLCRALLSLPPHLFFYAPGDPRLSSSSLVPIPPELVGAVSRPFWYKLLAEPLALHPREFFLPENVEFTRVLFGPDRDRSGAPKVPRAELPPTLDALFRVSDSRASVLSAAAPSLAHVFRSHAQALRKMHDIHVALWYDTAFWSDVDAVHLCGRTRVDILEEFRVRNLGPWDPSRLLEAMHAVKPGFQPATPVVGGAVGDGGAESAGAGAGSSRKRGKKASSSKPDPPSATPSPRLRSLMISKKVCFGFNGAAGCSETSCRFKHACGWCEKGDHNASTSPRPPSCLK